MSSHHLLPLIQETVQAFGLHYQEAMQPVLTQYSFRGGDWLRLFFANGVDPEPLTMDLVQTVFPFSTINKNREALVAASERDLLVQLDENSFRLSKLGRKGMAAFYQATGQAIADLQPMPEADMNRLANLLKRIVAATETAVAPKTHFLMSRQSDPGLAASAPIRIDQYLTDLTYFHNDTSRASWMSQNVSGPAWETLGYIADNGPQTAVAISQQFSERRGHSLEAYTATLQSLAAQKWLAADGESHTITDGGKAMRAEAAQAAEHAFYSSWNALTREELADLEVLLKQLNDGLRQEGMKNIWQLANGALGAAAPLYAGKTGPIMAEVGYNKPGYFIVTWQGLGLEPHPISVANLAKRFPYIAAQTHEERFQNMLTDGFLAAGESEGEYILTQSGRDAYMAVDQVFITELSQIEILSENGLKQVVELIGGIAERSAHDESQADKWNIDAMRRMHREDAAPQAKLDEYLDDLNAFRDDAHLTAYKLEAPNLSAPAWEAFTFLWRDGLNSGQALQERLGFRGHDATAYTNALRELVAHNWATENDGEFTLTDAGRTVREAVEQKTDDIFFAAWAALSNGQLAQLLGRLRQLRRNLQTLVGDKVVAERKEVWPQVLAMGRALFQLVGQRTQAVREELGLNRPFATLALLTAHTHKNDMITANHLQTRFPYIHPQTTIGHLQSLVDSGELRPSQNGTLNAYYLTDKGRQAIQAHLDSYWGEAAALQPMPEEKISRLAELFDRVVANTAQIAEPAKPSFEAMHSLDVPQDATPLVRIDHALDCLGALRDDAHVATFHIVGHAWEALGDIWQEAANTVEAIAERRQNRGYETADYAQVLAGLVKRGWLCENDSVYILTEAGQTVREEAEQQTDRYFYAPWAALNLDEIQEMQDLLSQLETGLKQLAEPVTA